MNRERIRYLQHLKAKDFLEVYKNVVNEEVEKQRSYAFNDLAACMFTELRERFPQLMTGEMMHSIALDTVNRSHGVETAHELDAILYAETGFSIYEPPDQSALRYIEKGESNGSD